MVRDQEIQRLVNYIKGLGLKITFTNKKMKDSAVWHIDNSEITISRRKNSVKIDMVLSLIHEAGHALHNIHEKNRQVDPKFYSALDHIDEAEEHGLDTKKRQRKVILDNERAGAAYWGAIYRETNMKFPIWKLDAMMEFDLWQYEFYYYNARYPKRSEKVIKWKDIGLRHRV